MITNDELVTAVRLGNGETERQAQASIAQAASALGVAPFCSIHASGECTEQGDVWHDDDADEIAMHIAVEEVDA